MAEEDISPEARKTITTGFWQQTTMFQKLLLATAILFPFYIASTTSLVPNYQCLNETINGTIKENCGVLYDYGDNVPKSFMSNGQSAIEGIIVLALFLTLFTQRSTGRIPIPEAIKIIKSEMRKIQTLPTTEGERIELRNYFIEIPTGVITRYVEQNPFRYTIGMKLINKINDQEIYYKAMFHPMTGYFDGFVPTDREMQDWDMCSKCGNEYGYKTHTTADLKKVYEIRKEMSGMR